MRKFIPSNDLLSALIMTVWSRRADDSFPQLDVPVEDHEASSDVPRIFRLFLAISYSSLTSSLFTQAFVYTAAMEILGNRRTLSEETTFAFEDLRIPPRTLARPRRC